MNHDHPLAPTFWSSAAPALSGRHVCEKLHRAGLAHHGAHPPRQQRSHMQHLPAPDRGGGQRCTTKLRWHVCCRATRRWSIWWPSCTAPKRLSSTPMSRCPPSWPSACTASGVRRLVHVSALGVALDSPSRYQRSKARGEAVLRDSGLDLTVLRPSVIFGAGDRFLNLFAQLQSMFPGGATGRGPCPVPAGVGRRCGPCGGRKPAQATPWGKRSSNAWVPMS